MGSGPLRYSLEHDWDSVHIIDKPLRARAMTKAYDQTHGLTMTARLMKVFASHDGILPFLRCVSHTKLQEPEVAIESAAKFMENPSLVRWFLDNGVGPDEHG